MKSYSRFEGKAVGAVPPVTGAAHLGGLLAGSKVATLDGWTAVDRLSVGDKVMTLDHGAVPVTCVSRQLYPYGSHGISRPVVTVPTGTIGNAKPLTLLPDQVVVVLSDQAEAATGDPFAAVRAASLLGLDGVRERLLEESVQTVILGFAQDQVVFLGRDTLALCPSEAQLAPATLAEALSADADSRYYVHDGRDAENFVRGMWDGVRPGSARMVH